MRYLIISHDTYSWIHSFYRIIDDVNIYDVMIAFNDDYNSMKRYPKLCRDAVYAQRRWDLFKIGKELGIKKLMHLNYDETNLDLYKLISQIQLYVMFNNITTVYYTSNLLIGNILGELRDKLGIKMVSSKSMKVTELPYNIKELIIGD